MRQQLRDYQQLGVDRILEAFRGGARTVLATSPTGSGKTTIFSHIHASLADRRLESMILVHRRELATQAATRLREFGVDFGYILSGKPRKPNAMVQIATVQTLLRRSYPRARFITADEAHLSTAETWRSVLAQYPDAKILGVTATPWRLAGRPLVGTYDASVVVATPRELREQGHLCPYVGFSYVAPDLSQIKTRGGDYNEQQTSEVMKAPQIVDNILEMWLAHASTLSTVVFAVTVDHSRLLCEKFKSAGVSAEHLDGKTCLETRERILKRVESGQTQVLCNVGVAVEGLDIPRLKCCVLARPTKSLARAIQMMGRVRRPWNGLTARIHDHAFNIKLHGLPDADRDYSLSAKPEKPPPLRVCENCLAMYSGTVCPSCNTENEPQIQGERTLSTVPDAEQFTFDSNTPEEKQPSVARPPVELKWNKPGRSVEGSLERKWEEATDYGSQKRYLVRGDNRQYSLPGCSELDLLMRQVQIHDYIRITHTRDDELPGGRTKHRFRLERDDGT